MAEAGGGQLAGEIGGLAIYHSRVRALAAQVPAGQRQAVAAFLAAAADAAATAVTELSR